jgi:hypothetical protein
VGIRDRGVSQPPRGAAVSLLPRVTEGRAQAEGFSYEPRHSITLSAPNHSGAGKAASRAVSPKLDQDF